MSDFVLDLDSNPHPVMLAGALAARRRARVGEDVDQAFWNGYLRAMADATGCSVSDLKSWLNAHEADQ